MLDANIDLNFSVCAKTTLGLQEVQSRALGLLPMARRLLILMDGNRNGKVLAPMVAGHDFSDLLRQLFEKNCIEVVNTGPGVTQSKISAAPESTLNATPGNPLAPLPAAESRTAKDTEMARNFMINTINMEFGQHMRISVIESIGACKSAHELRQVFPLWHTTMGSSRNAAKELSGLKEKLFRVL
jgi:hypothetical protein